MSDWRGQRVLVTGAAGFIGTNLVASLGRAGAEVHGLVRASTDRWRLDALAPRLVTHVADLADGARLSAIMRDVRPDVVFHTAAAGDHHPASASQRYAAFTDTVLGTASLCEALAAAGVGRLVYLGSSLEYGPAGVPLDESRALRPTTFRGVTKACATLLCSQAAHETGTPVVLLRPFSVYGPWESGSRFVATVMRALGTGGDLPLTRPGIRRDFVFVADVVEACLRAATAPAALGEIINIGSGCQTTNEALVDLAQEVAGVRVRVLPGAFPERPVDTGHWVADIDKARRLLDWSPRYSLACGLAETYRWFDEYGSLYAARPARIAR